MYRIARAALPLKTTAAKVIVEARSRGDKSAAAEAGGMKRDVLGTTGLTVEEENNTMAVRAASLARAVDITIQVPAKTSLKWRAHNSGEIKVEGVEGEIEANHLNGPVTLAGIAGSAVAHSLKGKVLVSFTRVEPNKAMSFSSLNGAIDVTFPADLRANVKMRSERGEIFTDFDIQMQPAVLSPSSRLARQGRQVSRETRQRHDRHDQRRRGRDSVQESSRRYLY